jgi:anti-anti-sigma regulatory factor
VAIDLEALYDIDATSVIMLDDLSKDLRGSGIEVVFTNVHRPVRQVLRREGLFDRLGAEHFYSSVDSAVARLATG